MPAWDSEQYAKFLRQRTQPARDLAGRIASMRPGKVVDIGCGPGNSTAVLKETFPKAALLGIDNSEEMLKKARAAHPDIPFRLGDIAGGMDGWGKYDVIFSNACLQWIPDHRRLIPALFDRLNSGGVLAVQMPMNGQEALFKIMEEVLSGPQWDFSSVRPGINTTLLPEDYFDILCSCTSRFELWETVYYHRMPSALALVEWLKGSRLRPYLDALDKTAAGRLEAEILRRAKAAYTARENGELLFRFRRFFFVAARE